MYEILTDLERWFDQNKPIGLASVIKRGDQLRVELAQ